MPNPTQGSETAPVWRRAQRRLAAEVDARPPVRRGADRARAIARRARAVPRGPSLDTLPADDVVRLVYQVLLRRDPDPGARNRYVPALAAGDITVAALVDGIRTSEEYRVRTTIGEANFLQSLHLSRIEFIRGLPPARRIIDLGGSATYDQVGALILMGYPYDFERLTIVDLPPEHRHSLYHSAAWHTVETGQGPVQYEYRSMTDLSFAADGTVDLVYSGQSIEHVSRDDARLVVAEVARVLRPGGWFVLDTPNAPVCRLQQPDFIDPDHEYEYRLDELEALVVSGGLDVVERKGLNLGHRCVSEARFDAAEFAANPGVFAAPESCYLLALTARKPPASSLR